MKVSFLRRFTVTLFSGFSIFNVAAFTGLMIIHQPWWAVLFGIAEFFTLLIGPFLPSTLKKITGSDGGQLSSFEERKHDIMVSLSADSRGRFRRMQSLVASMGRQIEKAGAQAKNAALAKEYLAAANKLLWMALKLFALRQEIVKGAAITEKEDLPSKLASLKSSLEKETNENLKRDLQATIASMEARQSSLRSSEEKIREVDIELLQTEEQLKTLEQKVLGCVHRYDETVLDELNATKMSINDTMKWMNENEALFASFNMEPDFSVPSDETLAELMKS